MSKLTISQAAEILEVNKKTLARWEEAGLLVPDREETSRVRVYDKERIEKIAKWFSLRSRHLSHLRMLGPIRQKLDKFIPKFPLDGNNPPEIHSFEEMKKAYGEMNEWKKELDEIEKEYVSFGDFAYGKLEVK